MMRPAASPQRGPGIRPLSPAHRTLLAVALAGVLAYHTPEAFGRLRLEDPAPPLAAGRQQYDGLCSRCHGGDGNGGELGPGIVARLLTREDAELKALVRDGLPAAGMPGFAINDQEMRELVAFLRTLPAPRGAAPERVTVETTDGSTLRGLALNRTPRDMQLLCDGGDEARLHLLRKAGDRYRRVTSQADWPTYNGQLGGNRWSPSTRSTRATWRGSRPGGCTRSRARRGSR